jgi:hypothetical protein
MRRRCAQDLVPPFDRKRELVERPTQSFEQERAARSVRP